MRQVGQDHRPARQDRGLPDDLVWRCARHGEFGEDLVQPFRRAQFLQLRVDDPGVHRLGDLHERDLTLEGDQRQPAVDGGSHQNARQGTDVPPAQLHRQRADPRHGEVRSVASQQRRLGGQRDPGGQHQLTALQQVRRVRQLEYVHPADPGSQAARARDYLRAAPADDVEAEQVSNGGQHTKQETTCKASQQKRYILSVPRSRQNQGRLGTMSELLARHRAVIPNWVGIYYDEPIEIVSGKGCRVTDAQGRGYLDFFAGILTNMLGYDVPEVRDAVERQIASGVVHTSTLYLIRSQVELAEKIARLSGIENAKVFFTNSGTEANETALLAALTARRANEVLAMRGSYHGRSFGAVSVTGNAAWKMSSHSPFGTHYLHGADRHLAAYASLSDADYIKACVEDLRALLAGGIHPADVGCLLAEPVQGVGGFTMPPDGLLAAYKEVLDEHGILLISDEVQTGWGRTGEHFWGISAHGIVAGRDDVRQGPRQRLRHRRRGGPRRPARRDPRQRHLHLRRQPGRDRGGQRHPGLRALPRPAAQRRGHRRPDHHRTAGSRAEPRHRGRRARQGPDVRRRPG